MLARGVRVYGRNRARVLSSSPPHWQAGLGGTGGAAGGEDEQRGGGTESRRWLSLSSSSLLTPASATASYGPGFCLRSSAHHQLGRFSSRSFASSAVNDDDTQLAVVDQAQQVQDAAAVWSDQLESSLTEAAAAASPHVNEVSAIADQSWLPVVALQQLIEAFHVYAHLPWWGAIAATTVALRALMLPLVIRQMKVTARLSLMRPQMEKLKEELDAGLARKDPQALANYQTQLKALFAKHQVSPFKMFGTMIIQAPLFICFFLAIRRMAEGIPSFAEGGPWFLSNLAQADPTYVMPVLTGMSLLLTVELGAMDGMEGQAPEQLKRMKNMFRIMAVAMVPLTANLPAGIFAYWLTSNICSLAQTAGIRFLGLRKKFGIPETSHLSKAAKDAVQSTRQVVKLRSSYLAAVCIV
eukprot:jgi/Chlat1/2304/Chrsp17S02799